MTTELAPLDISSLHHDYRVTFHHEISGAIGPLLDITESVCVIDRNVAGGERVDVGKEGQVAFGAAMAADRRDEFEVRIGGDRGQMLVAAAMGAVAFQKGLGATHAVSHSVGAIYNTHHGMTNAVVLPSVIAMISVPVGTSRSTPL